VIAPYIQSNLGKKKKSLKISYREYEGMCTTCLTINKRNDEYYRFVFDLENFEEPLKE
jgi:hypothetical protein